MLLIGYSFYVCLEKFSRISHKIFIQTVKTPMENVNFLKSKDYCNSTSEHYDFMKATCPCCLRALSFLRALYSESKLVYS